VSRSMVDPSATLCNSAGSSNHNLNVGRNVECGSIAELSARTGRLESLVGTVVSQLDEIRVALTLVAPVTAPAVATREAFESKSASDTGQVHCNRALLTSIFSELRDLRAEISERGTVHHWPKPAGNGVETVPTVPDDRPDCQATGDTAGMPHSTVPEVEAAVRERKRCEEEVVTVSYKLAPVSKVAEKTDKKVDKRLKGIRIAHAAQQRMLRDHVEHPEATNWFQALKRSTTSLLTSEEELFRGGALRGLKHLGHAPIFEVASTNVLAAYAVFLLVTAGMSQDEVDRNSGSLGLVNFAFVTLFVVEIFLLLLADGPRFFLKLWNVLDFLLVASAVLELLVVSVNLASLRLFRIFKVGRVLLAMRIVRRLRELRVLAHGLAMSLKALVWITLFLLILQSICAILLVDGLREHRDIELVGSLGPWGSPYTIGDFFGDTPSALFTLFQILTLESWCMGIVRPVAYHAPWTLGVIIPYIVFVTVAVMNVVTGIFVEQIVEASKMDSTHFLKTREHEIVAELKDLREFFRLGDADGDGCLNVTEFEDLLKESRVQAFFLNIGLDPHEATALFHALDFDDSGAVEIDEFLFGVMRVRSGVTGLDRLSLTYDMQRIGGHVLDLAEVVEQRGLIPRPCGPAG